jgi:catechol 2,3-dioxygenase-like lactoylglutathione lyase family enzyme
VEVGGNRPVKRGIDHLVLSVADLEAARRRYRSFGFTTTPRAEHPFGTANSLVQLGGNFLELLCVDAPDKIPPMIPGHFSFGAFNKRYAARRQGMSMLVLQSDDARRDQAEFAENGLQTYAPFDFSRQATLPDGSQVTVSFSLAFVTEERMPEAAFFVCQQHAPEYFWKPEYQRHANGATDVVEVVMVADDPGSFGDFFARLEGERSVSAADGALAVSTSRGRISMLTPELFAARFPDAAIAEAPATPHFAAYRVAVTDLDATEALFTERGVSFGKSPGRLRIAAPEALGVVIEFSAAHAGQPANADSGT